MENDILTVIPNGALIVAIGGMVTTFVVQAFKKWIKLRGEKSIVFLAVLFSALGGAIEAVLAADIINVGSIGSYAAATFAGTKLFYVYILKPIGKRVEAERIHRASLLNQTVAPLTGIDVPIPEETDSVAPVPEQDYLDAVAATEPVEN